MTLTYTLDDGVAVLRLDDGKVNTLDFEILDEMEASLERAKTEASAVLLVGREGRFSAGFNLNVLARDPHKLVTRGGRVMLGLYGHPQPVVAACTGHAVAGGAILLMCCDHRVGLRGEYKIGLNEVSIGMPMPAFVSGLARDRLAKTHFDRATLFSHMYDPDGAVSAGYLDQAVDTDPEGVALQAARALGKLHANAFAATKATGRAAAIERHLAELDDDITEIVTEMARSRT